MPDIPTGSQAMQIDQRVLILAAAALHQCTGLDDNQRAELHQAIRAQMSDVTDEGTHHCHRNARTYYEADRLMLAVPWNGGAITASTR